MTTTINETQYNQNFEEELEDLSTTDFGSKLVEAVDFGNELVEGKFIWVHQAEPPTDVPFWREVKVPEEEIEEDREITTTSGKTLKYKLVYIGGYIGWPDTWKAERLFKTGHRAIYYLKSWEEGVWEAFMELIDGEEKYRDRIGLPKQTFKTLDKAKRFIAEYDEKIEAAWEEHKIRKFFSEIAQLQALGRSEIK